MTAFTKDIVRTVGHSKKRFVSIAVICALGVTMLTGLVVACMDLRASADELFDTQKLFDVSVQSTLGLTQEDVDELARVDGVAEIEGTWQESAYTRIDGKRASVDVKALTASGMNEPYVLEGNLPQAANEVAVTAQYLKDSGKSIGDTLTFEGAEDDEASEAQDGAAPTDAEAEDNVGGDATDRTTDDAGDDAGDRTTDDANTTEVFNRRTYTITASVIDPTNITAPDGPVAFRAATSADYSFYVTPDAVEDPDVFTTIYLMVDGTSELSSYSDDYTQAVDAVIDRIDELTPQRERARAEQVREDALATIAREEADALAELDDAQAELDDAQATLDKSLAEALDGQRQLDEARATLHASLADALAGQRQLDSERASALAQLADAQTTIDANRAQIPDLSVLEGAIANVDTQAAVINDQLGSDAVTAAWSALGSAADDASSAAAQTTYLEAAREAVAALTSQIDAGIAQIDAAVPELDDTLASLKDAVDALTEQVSQVNAGIDELTKQIDPLAVQLTQAQDQAQELQASIDALDPADDGYADTLAQLEAQLADTQAKATELEQTLEPLQAQRDELTRQNQAIAAQLTPLQEQQTQLQALKDQRDQLVQQRAQLASLVDGSESPAAQLAAGKGQATVGLAQARSALALLNQAQTDLDAQRAAALAQLDAAQQQLDDGMAQISSGQRELDANQATIDAGLAEIADGQAELDEGRATFEEERADALQQIDDARAEVDDIGPATWYVQDRSNLGGFSSIDADTSSIEGIARVIPVIFFVVAVLVSLTTATRMVEEERTLIGLYKALGYSRGRILGKYVAYTLSAALIGGIVGDVLGFVALPLFLFSIFNVMYQLPILSLHFDAFYAIGAIALFVAGIVGATFITCRADLKETPATLMRPRSPRAGSRIFLEYIGPVWRRLGFLNKVTARNIFRYKKRFFMTVFGIMGCTALLVCGFAVKDTVAALSWRQYGSTGVSASNGEGIYEYDLMAVTSADDFDAAQQTLASEPLVEDVIPLLIDNVTVEYDGAKESMQLYVVPRGVSLDGYLRLVDNRDGSPVDLPQDGILITNNAATVLGFDAGATVSLKDSALNQADAEVAGVVTNYLGNAVYLSQDAYESIFGDFEANGFLAHLSGSPDEQIALSDDLAANDLFLSVSGTEQLALDFSESFSLINSVVYVVILLAAGLAFTVLFTLSTVNIAEREREIATIKVLGFRPPEVRRYINKETLVLTAMGIVLGLPAGWALGMSFAFVLKMPDINFAVTIEPVSYVISAALTVVFALVVNAITNRMLDRIIMVEALKSPE
ncbi:FtsX-like permease family protein [Collinsella sp. An2]|uniref:FtsX-like permease family protein n=1 Tax=Collinsella sp. An2 TaxID=1965585 RepID=UPI000B39FBE9|nr:FtsX-like permease family protein [Collinsella sp. An2]OUP06637.1 hypothetical protein B5F33_09910 [Collinsella sp. An2]